MTKFNIFQYPNSSIDLGKVFHTLFGRKNESFLIKLISWHFFALFNMTFCGEILPQKLFTFPTELNSNSVVLRNVSFSEPFCNSCLIYSWQILITYYMGMQFGYKEAVKICSPILTSYEQDSCNNYNSQLESSTLIIYISHILYNHGDTISVHMYMKFHLLKIISPKYFHEARIPLHKYNFRHKDKGKMNGNNWKCKM